MDSETALIVPCPAAESVAGDQRARLDRAARAGVPAHLTVLYPFKPHLVDDDHQILTTLFQSFFQFTIHAERTDWFDDRVVFVKPVDPSPVIAMTDAVEKAFPGYRIYGGIFSEVIPHVTIGHDQPYDALLAAERVVSARLPLSQPVTHVELWTGPALSKAVDHSWRRVRDYPLGR